MEVEIYADVIFLINFIMDLFIFWVISKTIKKTRFIRILLGSFLAAVSYCILVIFKTDDFLLKMILMILSILICFMPKNLKEGIAIIAAFIILSFFAGGMATGLFYFLNSGNGGNFSFLFLFFAAFVMFIISNYAILFYKKSILKKQTFCDVTLYCNNKKIHLYALIDTGNSLCEPFTKAPVIIAEYAALSKILPKLPSIENISEFHDISFRLIPFSAVGSEHGMLWGFSCEKAVIRADIEITVKNAIIAVCSNPLSRTGSYNALLNPEMLSGQNQ